MIVVLFARGSPESIDRIHRGSPARFAKLCRKRTTAGAMVWQSKAQDLRCELRSFDFAVTNIGEFRHLMATMANELYGVHHNFFIVTEPHTIVANPLLDAEMCECTLDLCLWCKTRNTGPRPRNEQIVA